MTSRPLLLQTTVLGSVLGLVACGGPDAPRSQHLARGFRPDELASVAGAAPRVAADGRARLVERDGLPWLETPLARADWESGAQPGLWLAEVAVRGVGRPRDDAPPQELVAGERVYRHAPLGRMLHGERPPTGSFGALGGRLGLLLEPGEAPPASATFRVCSGRGAARSGTWWTRGRTFSGAALPVRPGERWERSIELAPGSALRFATVLESAVRRPENHRVTFRATLDGVPVLEHEELDGGEPRVVWHAVRLSAPDEPARAARIGFEVTGAFAHTAFASPVVGPDTIGRYGRRPWGDTRPDVVLLVADTFRADNLAVYGAGHGVPLFLDRLARSGVLFERAWSASTHTLPAHGALFTGAFPRQTGAVSVQRALPRSFVTLAERLAASGYRTGAVTDAGMVSHRYGLAQGFEWFDEQRGGTESTLRRVRDFLAADDGRPTFLFVHTYDAHAPYEVDDATRARYPELLDADGDYHELRQALREVEAPDGERRADQPEAHPLADGLQRLYLGNVIDLDSDLERLHALLADAGVLDQGYLVFTSDHGEAFLAHDEMFHCGTVYEEQLRVPLFVTGPSLAPRRVDHAASLVDLPRTIAALAGVPPHPAWLGAPLLALDRDRPVFAFQAWSPPDESTFAVVEGARKVIGYEDAGAIRRGELVGAFDLARDASETEDLAGEPWSRDLLERHGPTVELLLEATAEREAAAPTSAQWSALRELGYVGD